MTGAGNSALIMKPIGVEKKRKIITELVDMSTCGSVAERERERASVRGKRERERV